jgi:hypothetical protein
MYVCIDVKVNATKPHTSPLSSIFLSHSNTYTHTHTHTHTQHEHHFSQGEALHPFNAAPQRATLSVRSFPPGALSRLDGMYTHTHTHTHTFAVPHIHIYSYLYIYTHTHAHRYKTKARCVSSILLISRLIGECVCVCMCMYGLNSLLDFPRIYIHTHTHTHTHAQKRQAKHVGERRAHSFY